MYHPGTSLLHRCPAGPKLLLLVFALIGATLWPLPAILPTVLLYLVARVPLRLVVAQLRPVVLFIALTALIQVLTAGLAQAVAVGTGLLLSVALAALVTLTTRMSDMLDVLTWCSGPLRRVGIPPDRIALLLALTIRCVPLMADILGSVREAQRARGALGNPMAMAVPAVVRALRAADAIGEALTARGFDDD